MEILLVRHGQSQANAEGRMQGRLDSALTELGEAQASRLGAWLEQIAWRPAEIFCSPLLRAQRTAQLLSEALGCAEPRVDERLVEVDCGALEGLSAEEIGLHHPEFLQRKITELGDFGALGGESYEQVQARVIELVAWLKARAASSGDEPERVALVAHGGVHFQLLKALICEPVPPVAIVRFGNCSCSLVALRQRRGEWMGELRFHLPLELIEQMSSGPSGGEPTPKKTAGIARVFE